METGSKALKPSGVLAFPLRLSPANESQSSFLFSMLAMVGKSGS